MGGDGPNSYAKNSNLQECLRAISGEPSHARKAADVITSGRLVPAIFANLDIENPQHSSISTAFRIAHLGCSVGPKTFIQVKNIVDAVAQKYQHTTIQVPEFQVHFSDLVSNDFNYLFATLPRDKQYFAAGVPGLGIGNGYGRRIIAVIYL
ncbi:paraxanthine methyltransferase 1-like [Pyrus x bretschneideri]|uniref:paraxanthine methyltransferase 1-like n=1 Tax=Pyrus x bretschneideri TaxID=225117 RepID=UPI00202E8CE5|nr:paraxanthine methyltransferase 1-like [Pyrus x bretschneideri]